MLYSLIETAKAVGIDPRTYLRDVLLRIETESDVASLTPHGWKERWEPVVLDHQADLLQRLVVRADAAE